MNIINKIEILIRKKQLEKYFTKKYFDYIILVLALALSIYCGWSVLQTALGLVVLYFFLISKNSLEFARATSFFFLLAIIASVFGYDGKAEKLAVVALSFLAIAVIAAISENRSKYER